MPTTNFDLAPRVKTVDGLVAVPIDIQHISATLAFDGAMFSGAGDATLEFVHGPQNGNPIFDLRQTITGIWLDGVLLAAAQAAHHDFGGGANAGVARGRCAPPTRRTKAARRRRPTWRPCSSAAREATPRRRLPPLCVWVPRALPGPRPLDQGRMGHYSLRAQSQGKAFASAPAVGDRRPGRAPTEHSGASMAAEVALDCGGPDAGEVVTRAALHPSDLAARHFEDAIEVPFGPGPVAAIPLTIAGHGQLAMGVRLLAPATAKPGETFIVDLVQRDEERKRVVGGLAIHVRMRKEA